MVTIATLDDHRNMGGIICLDRNESTFINR